MVFRSKFRIIACVLFLRISFLSVLFFKRFFPTMHSSAVSLFQHSIKKLYQVKTWRWSNTQSWKSLFPKKSRFTEYEIVQMWNLFKVHKHHKNSKFCPGQSLGEGLKKYRNFFMAIAIKRRIPPPLNGTNFHLFFYPTFFFCNCILLIWNEFYTRSQSK